MRTHARTHTHTHTHTHTGAPGSLPARHCPILNNMNSRRHTIFKPFSSENNIQSLCCAVKCLHPCFNTIWYYPSTIHCPFTFCSTSPSINHIHYVGIGTCETGSVPIADTINSWSLYVYHHLIPTWQYLKYKLSIHNMWMHCQCIIS